MKTRLANKIIIIPLHHPFKHPCDYIDQTTKILTKKNTVILFDYYYPYSWKEMLKFSNLKLFFRSLSNIRKLKKTIYFRAPAILPFSKLKIIIDLNKKLGFWVLSVFLWIFNKQVVVWQFYALITKKIFKKQYFIYDCIDYMNLEDETRKFFYKEKKLFKTSDLVNFNSKGLFEKKLKTNQVFTQKSIVTVCGCNNKFFNVKSKEIPKELLGIRQKKIVFMGVFNFRVNVKLLDYVVTNNKNFRFIFIGPIRKNAPKKIYEILKENNALYLGEKEKNDLPFYLKNCNLGIIPYDTKSEFVKYSNPMKAYEYLASGLPVVSTDILALKNYPKDIVHTTDNKEEFSQSIMKLMNNWNDKKITIARNIAEKNSWENKIRLIEKFIIKNEKTN